MNISPEGVLALDPAFVFSASGDLRPTEPCDPHQVWRSLTSQVARDPLNVESHTRRVLLAIENTWSLRLTSAMVDLFLALGTHGKDLRTELLVLAKPQLQDELISYFQSRLDSDSSPIETLPLGIFASLDGGLMGAANLVAQHRSPVPEETITERALHLIDIGEIAAAQALLETSLLETPDDSRLTEELLAIYRHNRDSRAETEMRHLLVERHGRLPLGWV